MHRRYDDIILRISSAPVWWQEGGVPRYDPFHPETSTGVYAQEAAVAEIATQCCETTFLVLIETNMVDRRIAAMIRDESLRYGDPPNVYCCEAGVPSHSTVMLRVIEYWARADQTYVEDNRITDDAYYRWVRDCSLEIVFNDPRGEGSPVPPRGERWAPRVRKIRPQY